ncbi:MAG: helix-turn-helix transcriptional regulator [bacterium]|nr:helix-turn-helix transcriptional regulator [bacterium]
MKRFGKLLAKHREGYNKTITWLSKQLGIDRGNLGKMEKGQLLPPKLDIVDKIALLLHLDSTAKSVLTAYAAYERSHHYEKEYLDRLNISEFITYSSHYIPIHNYPENRPTPFIDAEPTGHFPMASSKIQKHFYAVYFNEPEELKMEFKQRDILVFDPLEGDIKPDDYVMIKVEGRVMIRKYREFKAGDDIFCQFIPNEPEIIENAFNLKADGGDFKIFGKMVFAFKEY